MNNVKRRGARSSYAGSQPDLYTSLGHNGTTTYMNHSYSAGDLLDYQRQESSPQTPVTNSASEAHLIPETPPEEKKRIFR